MEFPFPEPTSASPSPSTLRLTFSFRQTPVHVDGGSPGKCQLKVFLCELTPEGVQPSIVDVVCVKCCSAPVTHACRDSGMSLRCVPEMRLEYNVSFNCCLVIGRGGRNTQRAAQLLSALINSGRLHRCQPPADVSRPRVVPTAERAR